MRAFAQWIVWKLEPRPGSKDTKVPYDPKTGQLASVTDPRTWGTYDDACRAFGYGGFSGIGFVLTDGDPFAFIDLDDTHGDGEAYARQHKIFSQFDSYSELSPSGRGLHIIVKGRLPHGRRRAYIEIYSSERYMTMTGNVFHDAPIVERQDLLEVLFKEMGGPAATHVYGQDQDEREPDDVIIQRASSAANGDKFSKLWIGDYQSFYPSQSEADFALVDILAYYTQNKAQIARLFRASALGQRDKAQRNDYVAYMVNKSFDRQLPPIDVEGLRVQYEALKSQAVDLMADPASVPPYVMAGDGVTSPPAGHVADNATQTGDAEVAQASTGPTFIASPEAVNLTGDLEGAFPPGLVGEVAQFIYEQAPRPVRRIALAGAIGLVAGIVGRAYNVSRTGLNQYVLLLAPTGTGKEAISSGISTLMGAIKQSVPASAEFIGPGEIRSDAALIKWLGKSPCFVSVTGEFGLRLKQMSHPNASPHEVGLRRVLLDLFNKSGKGNVLSPMAYSDKEKNTESVTAPAFTIIGESTPERFYEALDESMIYEGLLPRFTVLEYKGPRPPRNPNSGAVNPPFYLVEQLATITAHCKTLMHQNQVIDVQMTSDAQFLFDNFDVFCDRQINSSANEVIKHLWNRAHIKAMKLGALIAVGVYPFNPIIDRDQANWAIATIVEEVNALLGRFERGEIGAAGTGASNELKQAQDVVRVIREYCDKPFEECAKKYRVAFEMQRDGVIPHDYLTQRLAAVSSFRLDRMGATNAIKRAVASLLDNGDIAEMRKDQMHQRYGKQAKAYVVVNPARFRPN